MAVQIPPSIPNMGCTRRLFVMIRCFDRQNHTVAARYPSQGEWTGHSWYHRRAEGVNVWHARLTCGWQAAKLPSPPRGLRSSNLLHWDLWIFPFWYCVTLLWERNASLPPPPTPMTPSDKLGVHPFHWLVCWQIECPCLRPRVTPAGSTCVWLDQQVAGTASSVILKPLFIHNSSPCSHQSHVSPALGINRLGYFIIPKKEDRLGLKCMPEMQRFGITCKTKICSVRF